MIPKFRAWDKHGREMKDVTTLEFVDNKLDYVCFDYNEVGLLPDNVILMQSTGLKDKNGVEIFEGDVLQNRNYTKNIFICKKSELQAAFVAKTQNGLLVSNFWTDEMHDWEVVGNIYENPELLEVPHDQ